MRSAVPTDVLAVCQRLRERGHEAHLVGGGVRDMLLGREPADFDVATDARPEAVLDLFGHAYAIPTGIKHGTVTVLTNGISRHVEVTTFRGEGAYLDGRRPSSVTYTKSLEEDLARRDFTMNAVAYDPIDDRVADPFEGRDDLNRRLIRAVGDPLARFNEDGLRPMRAVRQAAQLEFTIEAATRAAIPQTLDVVRKVSAERIRDELLKLLAAPRPSHGLELMRETGLLAVVLPELLEGVGCTQNRFHKHDVYGHTLAVVDQTRGDAIVRLGALLHDVGKPRARQPREGAPGEYSFFKHEYVGRDMADEICRRLKLSNADRERVVGMVAHHMFYYSPDWTDGAIRRFVRNVGGAEALDALFALREGDVAGRGFGEDPDTEIAELKRRIDTVASADAALKVTDLAIDGKDVMRVLGIPPSRQVGRVLERLLEKVLDDATLNTRERLEALAPEVWKALEDSAVEPNGLRGRLRRPLLSVERGHESGGGRDGLGRSRPRLGLAVQFGAATDHRPLGIGERQDLDLSPGARARRPRGPSIGSSRDRQDGRQGDAQTPFAATAPDRHVDCRAPVRFGRRARHGFDAGDVNEPQLPSHSRRDGSQPAVVRSHPREHEVRPQPLDGGREDLSEAVEVGVGDVLAIDPNGAVRARRECVHQRFRLRIRPYQHGGNLVSGLARRQRERLVEGDPVPASEGSPGRPSVEANHEIHFGRS